MSKDALMVLPLFQKDQWEMLRDIDTKIDKTWDEWNAEGEEFIVELETRGISYVQVPLDVAELQQYCEEQGIPSDSVARCKFVRFKYNQIEKPTIRCNQKNVTYHIDGEPVTVASLQAVAEFVPVTNRTYLALHPRTEEEEMKMGQKLDLGQQLDELSTKATQKWAARPGAETCNTVTVRCYDCGAAYIGIVFIVSARVTYSGPDRYAAYFCPTWEDVEALRADFTQIAVEVGFVASK